MREFLTQLEEAGLLDILEEETIRLQSSAQPTLTIPAPPPEHDPQLDDFHVTSGIELRRKLAEGGMGAVYLGRQETLRRDVAVKAVREERRSHGSAQALVKEARVTGRLEHPNIVPVHDLGIDAEGSPLFVMRKIDGVAWIDLLDRPEQLSEFYEGMPELDRHLEIFDQVCRAVHFAHARGILHRDLKPDNVMLGAHGEVYVVDWGLAATLPGAETFEDLPRVADIDRPSGTPVYMAPEMVNVDTANMGPWTDVYLLGATLHTMLTGKTRHSGKSLIEVLYAAQRSDPAAYDGELPEVLGEICNKATRQDPGARYQTVEALRRAVAEFQRHRTVMLLLEQSGEKLEMLQSVVENPERGETEIVDAYQHYNSALFGFEAATEIWPDSEEARRGIRASHLAMFDLEIAQGHVLTARSLLNILEEPAPDREAVLEAKKVELETEQARIQELERRALDLDPRVDRRKRGLMLLGCVLTLLATNLTYVYLLNAGIVVRTAGVSIALRLIDTTIIQLFVSATLYMTQLNRSSRHFIRILLLTIWTGFVARALTLQMGLPLDLSGVFESLIYTMGMAAGALVIDRRLHFLWPIVSMGIWINLIAPEHALPVRIAVNILGLALIAWMGLRAPSEDSEMWAPQ